MKKLLRTIRIVSHKIGYIVDKFIIVPITKLVVSISSKFDHSGRKFENWLSKSNTLLFISLFLAIVIFIIIDQKIILFTDNSAEVLKNRPVEVIYNEESYVIEGLPETVDITLIGSKTDLYIAKQSSSHNVTVDLTGLKPGTHRVNMEYTQNAGKIDYMVNPSVATVVIYRKVSETRTLTVDILNQDSLDPKYVIDNVDYETDKIVIKGAEHQLKQVVSVKALVDIKNLVSTEVGTTTLKDVPLKAYDSEGNVVDVEIVPSKIDVDVMISSPSKEVPLRIVPVGEVSFGQAISTLNANVTNVTVYGDAKTLETLNYIPIEIDVTDLKSNKEYKLEIPKPIGVRSLSVNNVTVNVTLDDVSSRDIENVTVNMRNVADGLRANAKDSNAASVTVNLKGVKSVIDAIRANDITASVDLSGLTEPGEYEVEVQVEGTDPKVQYTSKTRRVRITLTRN